MLRGPEPTNSKMLKPSDEIWRQLRAVLVVIIAGVIANTCYWVYRESGGTNFFVPMLALHAGCISIGVLINRKYNASRPTVSS